MDLTELVAGEFADAARKYVVTVGASADVKLYVYHGPPNERDTVCTISHAATADPTVTWSAVYITHSQAWKDNVVFQAARVWLESIHDCDG